MNYITNFFIKENVKTGKSDTLLQTILPSNRFLTFFTRGVKEVTDTSKGLSLCSTTMNPGPGSSTHQRVKKKGGRKGKLKKEKRKG